MVCNPVESPRLLPAKVPTLRHRYQVHAVFPEDAYSSSSVLNTSTDFDEKRSANPINNPNGHMVNVGPGLYWKTPGLYYKY